MDGKLFWNTEIRRPKALILAQHSDSLVVEPEECYQAIPLFWNQLPQTFDYR